MYTVNTWPNFCLHLDYNKHTKQET